MVFARYAYPPNELGYCGPADHQALLEYGATGGVDGDLRRLAAGFEGAWPYLRLIADCAGIGDPLDRRVVEAYWIGNDCLDLVEPARFAASLRNRSAARSAGHWTPLVDWAHSGTAPHHGFQVFAVYPWAGLLHTGAGVRALHVLDRCRIRWGRVRRLDGERVVVRSRALRFDGGSLRLGEPADETAKLSATGYRLAPRIQVGDRVALHWDWVCDRLDDVQVAALRAHTVGQLAFTSAQISRSGVLAAPG